MFMIVIGTVNLTGILPMAKFINQTQVVLIKTAALNILMVVFTYNTHSE